LRKLASTAAVVAILAATAAPAGAQTPDVCAGNLQASQVEPQTPKRPLQFGITPGIQTGQLGTGPVPPRLPDDPQRTLAALEQLKPPQNALVLRLHRFFWSDGEEGVKRFLALKDRYTSRGHLVELQLRYHPNEQQEGDIAAWTKHVRDVVNRFGSDPRVVAIQVTNEVNLTFSPDSSDGSYANAKDALVQGVIAAQDEKQRRGYDQLEIGFNWAYRSTPQEENTFWTYLRDHDNKRFVDALDWIALDVYPGTFIPPVNTPGGERDAVVNALSVLRDCYAPIANIPATVPLHIEENGFPTSEPTRTYARQAEIAEGMIRAFHDYSRNYNIADYRWFNLRDGDSTSPNFQTQYGIMRDDYTPKPAFETVRRLFAELSPPARPGHALNASGRCAKRRAALRSSATNVRSVDFFLDGKPAGRDAHAPFEATRRTTAGRHRVTARAVMVDGSQLRTTKRFTC
jgi:hypothetical protein